MNRDDQADWHRVGLPIESRTYEVVKPPTATGRFRWEDLTDLLAALVPFDQEEPPQANTIGYEQWDWRNQWDSQIEPGGLVNTRLRLIEHIRTLYRKNDLTGLLPLATVESLALNGESYKLALTPELSRQLFVESGKLTQAALEVVLANEGKYVHSEGDANWWIPAGRVFYSPNDNDPPAQELANANQHFFLAHRFRDPFHATSVSTESFVDYDGYDLLMTETRDPLGNRITVAERDAAGSVTRPGNDYRVLQPKLITDPNRNRAELQFDALGMVVGTAVKGKEDTVGDTLNGFKPDLTKAEVDGFYEVPDPHVSAPGLLQGATTRIVYDLDRFRRTKQAHPEDPTQWLPVYAATLARETHLSDTSSTLSLKIQISFSYSDGFGREIQKKIQAEPGPLVEGGPIVSPRWVGSGWTIFNNKGKPVRQYEPFFSQLAEKRHKYEFGVQIGVSPILFYDPVGRVVATLHPNHTYEKIVFDPWQQTTYDLNDTVTTAPSSDDDVLGFFVKPDGTPRIAASDYLPTWYAQRIVSPPGNPERAAAQKAALHASTPTVAHFDTLGRPFLTLAHNGFKPDGTPIQFHTRVKLDSEGNQREVRDAIEQNSDTLGRIVMSYDYDMLGSRIHQASMEAGARWMLNDVAGKPLRVWDSRVHAARTEYDPLRRPLRSFVTGADPGNPNQEFLTERLVYGEQHPEAELRNLRGKLYLHLDQAGVVTSEEHDFKGNALRASRRLTNGTQYQQALDWTSVDADHVALPADTTVPLDPVALEAALAPRLETDTYTSSTAYDGLNRPITLTTPHTPVMQPSVIRPSYNEANLLERVDANLRGATASDGQPVWTPFVKNIDYDAKGQRTLIEYGSGATEDRKGVTTTYTYDPLTFRLTHLLTERNAVDFSGDCPQPPPNGWPGCQVQNLHYTYDPIGNITHIRDDAQQIIYFRNRRVEPSNDYTYDALYRLIEATGREHLGQIGGTTNAPTAPDAFNGFHTRLAHPADGNAMGTYLERYAYDAVGNFLEMQHRGSDPVHPGWTRSYAYRETSLIEDGPAGAPFKTSNRLSSTTVGENSPPVERYVYDAHGNTIRMPHLGGAHPDANMHWDYRDQLSQTDLGGGGTVYYVYDAAGQRVRKVWEKPANLVEERIYFGSFEIYRRRQGTQRLERETLHIMDEKHPIALVETRTLDTAGTDLAPPQLIRYQVGNHLGSIGLELDHQAQIISYQEYTPYGSTSYQAVRSQIETPKRYCYTGKERDDESGLYYHGARYYAPWIAQWVSAQSVGPKDALNRFAYVNRRPIVMHDPNGADGEYSRYLSGVGHALVEIVTGGSTVEDIQQAYRRSGGGLEGTLMAIDKANPVARMRDAAVGAYERGGGGLEGSLMAVDALNPAARVRDTAAEAYERGGGGLEGSLMAVDALNPVARVRDSGAATIDAIGRGDTAEAGRQFTHTLVGAAALVAPFARGTGIMRSGGRAPSPRAPSPRAPSPRAAPPRGASPQAPSARAPSQPAPSRGHRGASGPESGSAGGQTRGTASGRPFDPSRAGGPIRQLSTQGIRVTGRGIDVVEGHLARFGPDGANAAMVGRLRRIAAGELEASSADLNFYSHELRESVRYRQLGHPSGDPGYDVWNNAHTATLEDYGLREGPGVLYHPEVEP